MLNWRRRRWTNINPTLSQRFVFAGMPSNIYYSVHYVECYLKKLQIARISYRNRFIILLQFIFYVNYIFTVIIFHYAQWRAS